MNRTALFLLLLIPSIHVFANLTPAEILSNSRELSNRLKNLETDYIHKQQDYYCADMMTIANRATIVMIRLLDIEIQIHQDMSHAEIEEITRAEFWIESSLKKSCPYQTRLQKAKSRAHAIIQSLRNKR